MQAALMRHLLVAAMPTALKVIFIILTVILVAIITLFFIGRRLQKKQGQTQQTIDAMKQTMSMLIIDKKKMKIKESGLPAAAIEGTPKYLRWTKIPVVKAKVGPKVMTLAADGEVFDLLPVKKECKVDVSGLYITGIRSVRGGTVPKPEKKKGIRGWLQRRNKQISGRTEQFEKSQKAGLEAEKAARATKKKK